MIGKPLKVYFETQRSIKADGIGHVSQQFVTLLLARAKAMSCFVSDSGTPSAMIATTRIVGCFRADKEEAAALQIQQITKI